MARDATRRRVLASAAAALPLVAAGCKGIGALGTPPRAAPDVAVAVAAIEVETQLIKQYTVVLGAMPALGTALRPLLAQHQEHLTRLRSRLIVPAGRRLALARARARGPVPVTPAAALDGLRGAENAAAAALLAHLPAASPSLAQLLASISASEATHALILGTGAGHR